jgi:MarR family transcriptional regulator, organic hydroperoxide resistance regulator
MSDHRSPAPSDAATPAASAEVGTRYEGPGASPGFALWRVAAVWQRRVRAALQEVELTHAQFVLLVSSAWLQAAGDQPVTQALVSAHANTDAVMTSEVLRTLERKKLVRRQPHPTDARAKHIVLTTSGKVLSRRAIALVEAVDEEFFGAPGEELQALVRLICPRAKGG